MSLGIEEKYIIPGEKFLSSINTTLKHFTSRIEGVLCLTNFKVKYSKRSEYLDGLCKIWNLNHYFECLVNFPMWRGSHQDGGEWARWFLLDLFDDDLKLWENSWEKGEPVLIFRHWLQGCEEDTIQIHIRLKRKFILVHNSHSWECIHRNPKVSSVCLSQDKWSWRYPSWMVDSRSAKGIY